MIEQRCSDYSVVCSNETVHANKMGHSCLRVQMHVVFHTYGFYHNIKNIHGTLQKRLHQ